MAAIQSNGTGGGDWSAGASWSGGTPPVSADDVTIVVGDTITKDTAAGSNDCASLAINGVLAVGSNGIKVGGNITGTGGITMGAGGSFWTTGDFPNGHTIDMSFIGTTGSRWSLQMDGSVSYVFGSRVSGGCVMRHGNVSVNTQLRIVAMGYSDDFYDVDFDIETGNYCYLYWDGGGADNSYQYLFRDCYFHGGNYGVRGGNTSIVNFENCGFGKDRSGASDTNAVADIDPFNQQGEIFLLNCELASSTPITISDTNKFWVVRSVNHNKVNGDWRKVCASGSVFRSTASKRNGDYGIEFVPGSDCSGTIPLDVEIEVPVQSGDSIAPAIYLRNETADLNLQDAAGRCVVTLDPGNEWGLFEVVDVNGFADLYQNWRQVTFTGGTADGTSDRGVLRIRITLMQYVASAVLYAADLSY